MTDLEILGDIISTLDGVQVPVSLARQIALPLMDASAKLKALRDAIVEALRRREEQEDGAGDGAREKGGN